MTSPNQNEQNNQSLYSAIDLGSNSFHLAIAKFDGQSFQVISRLKEKVQLARGLDSRNNLSEEAIERGLNCLRLFADRLKSLPNTEQRIVATYTLRKAKNAHIFIEQAEKILNNSIDILPGIEEARLIYNGVSHYHPDISKALVIDIGGGSTEIILGKKFKPLKLDSLSLGCVTYNRFFPDGIITKENFNQGLLSALLELSPVRKKYSSKKWEHCIGSSGSIEAVHNVIQALGYKDAVIQHEHLKMLQRKVIALGSVKNVKFEGLSESRRSTFCSGLIILLSLFKTFNIKTMHIANASLREGILLEIGNELQGKDIRSKTVSSLQKRFDVDKVYAKQIRKNAKAIYKAVSEPWNITEKNYKNLLKWSCNLHEVGLAISLNKLKEHSSHIINYADMPGFSLQTKESLAAIVRNQNKKIMLQNFQHKYEPAEALLKLTLILRISLLFNIKRNGASISQIHFNICANDGIHLKIPKLWAEQHNLTMFELKKEKSYWDYHGLKLNWELV